MKIKVKPEDFVVEEQIKRGSKNGPYGLFLLEKRNWNTIDVLKHLSSTYKIPFSYLSAAGRKDRYAVTRQYVAIKGVKNREFRSKNWHLFPVGEINRPLSADLIVKNKFQVVLRKLSQEEIGLVENVLQAVKKNGLINYYGEQRFGTYDALNGFVGEKIVKKEFKGALKAFLCTIHPGEKKETKERKRFFFAHFDDPELCLNHAKTKIERRIFSFLAQNKDYFRALNLIPKPELEFQLSIYQSYLWNLFLRELLLSLSLQGYEIKGRVNKYFFPTELPKERQQYLSQKFVTPGYNARMPDELSRKIYQKVLQKHNLKPSDFNFRKFRTCYIKSFTRRGLIKLEDLQIEHLGKDELYPKHYKVKLCFSLPSGSYATILIKHIQAYIAAVKGYNS